MSRTAGRGIVVLCTIALITSVCSTWIVVTSNDAVFSALGGLSIGMSLTTLIMAWANDAWHW